MDVQKSKRHLKIRYSSSAPVVPFSTLPPEHSSTKRQNFFQEDSNTNNDISSKFRTMPINGDSDGHRRKPRRRVLDLSTEKITHSSALSIRSKRKNKKIGAQCNSTQQLRAAELALWEHNPRVLVLRKMMLICCWSAVATFVLIPAGFSTAYAMTFPDEIAHKWY